MYRVHNLKNNDKNDCKALASVAQRRNTMGGAVCWKIGYFPEICVMHVVLKTADQHIAHVM